MRTTWRTPESRSFRATMTERCVGRLWFVPTLLLVGYVMIASVDAMAQSPRISLATHEATALRYDAAFEKKQRRLNIAGWTLVGVGIAFPVATGIARATTESNCADPIECPLWPVSVTSFVLGPVMALIGGGLLIRRKRLRKGHDDQTGAVITPGLTGISVSGRF